MNWLIFSCVLLAFLFVTNSNCDNATDGQTEENFTSAFPIVCTRSGCIEGIAQPGYQIDEYEAFFGIPYAEPPVGNLRFANPVPVKKWNHLLNGKVERLNCIQKNYLTPKPTVDGVEDCLYLNVYRPKNTSTKNNSSLPVMVYIHEGGFFSGSIHTLFRGPQYFMDSQQVVLVLLTYRLGPLGFLSTGDAAAPGNFGLKDQVQALKWLKKNIKDFGGNPDSITIFGASAGAVSVHMHMMSPLSQGLFHRAIVMSGTAIAPYNEPTKNPLALAKRQAELVGIENIENLTTYDLIEKLRQVNASLLVDSGDDLKIWSVDPLTTYRPVIETEATGAFLTADPSVTWEKGNFTHIPWMIGVVANEGSVRSAAILSNKDLLDDLNFRLDGLLPKLMEITLKNPKNGPQLIKRIQDFYLNGNTTVSQANSKGFMDLYSDRAFLYPLYKVIENYLKYADTISNPVYLYRFAYKGTLSYSTVFTGTNQDFGVGHIDDLIYMFKTPILFPEFKRTSDAAQLIRMLTDTYIHFAKYGRPIVWNEMEDCIPAHRGNICDYQEFRNVNNDKTNLKFEIQTNNQFNMEMVKFWDEILKL